MSRAPPARHDRAAEREHANDERCDRDQTRLIDTRLDGVQLRIEVVTRRDLRWVLEWRRLLHVVERGRARLEGLIHVRRTDGARDLVAVLSGNGRIEVERVEAGLS